jgi:hypothetical protein
MVAYAMAKNEASHHILRITFRPDGHVGADNHLMEFFTGVSSTYVNQIAFSLSGANGKPYAFFVGKTFDFNTIMSASTPYAAGYLMKYAMESGDDLVTECSKS